MLPKKANGNFSKYVTKPFLQPAATDCILRFNFWSVLPYVFNAGLATFVGFSFHVPVRHIVYFTKRHLAQNSWDGSQGTEDATVSHSAQWKPDPKLNNAGTISQGQMWARCTEKCRFMGEEVREISRFFVAPPREFPLSVCPLTHLLIFQKYPHLSKKDLLNIDLVDLNWDLFEYVWDWDVVALKSVCVRSYSWWSYTHTAYTRYPLYRRRSAPSSFTQRRDDSSPASIFHQASSSRRNAFFLASHFHSCAVTMCLSSV